MSYSIKVAGLVKLVAPRVPFTSIEQAEEIASWYKQPHDSKIYQKVHRHAENLLKRQDRYGLTSVLDTIGECRQTKLSALREAIMVSAVNYYVACSADKVMYIIGIIEPLVQFDSVEEAEEYANWETMSHDSEPARAVYNMAEMILGYDGLPGLAEALDNVGSSNHARLSALRDAIKRSAERYITRVKLNELAELGDIDKRALVPAIA